MSLARFALEELPHTLPVQHLEEAGGIRGFRGFPLLLSGLDAEYAYPLKQQGGPRRAQASREAKCNREKTSRGRAIAR